MSWFYRTFLRPALFAQESEDVHDRTLRALAWASRREVLCDALASFYATPCLPMELFGLKFPNPIGLAAGMDKYAAALPIWPALGFGFSELGGVTWHAQPGNPAPRLFRAVSDEALINRMGFNNPGAQVVAQRLTEWRTFGRWPNHPVGINLGKSKITPLDQAAEDYASSFRLLRPHADFFVVNVSSPNTPNLRQLQDKAALDEILAALQEVNGPAPRHESEHPLIVLSERTALPLPVRNERGEGRGEGHPTVENPVPLQSGRPSSPRPSPPSAGGEGEEPGAPNNPQSAIHNPQSARPILVKVAPDLSFDALDEILELAGPRQIAGIVATNTTLARPDTADEELKRIYAEAGGLSGRPLRARSTEIIRHLHRQTGGALPIIGVGGIFNADDAWDKITAGASLVQIYTGLVYEGPGVVKSIVSGLVNRMEALGLRGLPEAVGQMTLPLARPED
ncbi:MAG TPA: dihydroorotate dehydrogenase (quinone) [Verrucomicrobiae bacterium]|jgi:dihydroorotate dehydrogenase